MAAPSGVAVAIDGRAIAGAIRSREEPRIRELLAARGSPPRAVIFARDDRPDSEVYLAAQQRVLRSVGIGSTVERFSESTGEVELVERVRRASEGDGVVAVSLHQPLPRAVHAVAALAAVDPSKDIEGTHPENLGRLELGESLPAPCAARAVLECIRHAVPDLRGKHVVVIGRSALLGRPLVELLLGPAGGSPTVTVCHTGTSDLALHTQRADVLVAAAGWPHLVRRDMVSPGAVVIDAGTSVEDGRVVGDVETPEVAAVASAITLVPGGVGPVCTALLLANLRACLERQGPR